MSTTSFSVPLTSILLNPELSLETKQAIVELLLEEVQAIENLIHPQPNS